MDIPLFNSDEEKLKDSLSRYKQMIDDTPICIKVFDGDGKLIFINKGGRKEHFIKDTDDISKWDWVATVKKEYQPQVLEAFKQGLGGTASEVLMEHTPEGSSHGWCQGIISPIKGENGKVNLLLFYSIDATAKMEAKKQLEKKEKELEIRNDELQKINGFMVGRELNMVKLKERIKELEKNKTG
ncbi:PAS domain-containing protein [Candidatus Roizmanbacteria bacterium]|nr:PAS domain-containing protein [Candidatus Roizmanbacteria bacterium]